MRYLVTGGAGFIGSNLCLYLLKNKFRVLCLDDLSTGSIDNLKHHFGDGNFEFVEHDFTKPFFPEDIDGIFNLASPASPVHYQYNPIRTLKMGTLAIYNVLGVASRLNVPALQASTSEVYGDPLIHPQTEEYWGNVNPIGPRACYDEGKRVAESLCVSYRDYSGTSIRIARIFNTYGPFMHPSDGRVVSTFIQQALHNQPLTVYGDGLQTRSFCFVDDTVRGLFRLMESSFQSPVNIGNPNEITIIELAKTIIDLVNSSSGIKFEKIPLDDPKKRCPDISKAQEVLNWEPQTNLREGLLKTIEWNRKFI